LLPRLEPRRGSYLWAELADWEPRGLHAAARLASGRGAAGLKATWRRKSRKSMLSLGSVSSGSRNRGISWPDRLV
ncbi:hypothetical protein FKM82_008732, partial [Ascaphus truei]